MALAGLAFALTSNLIYLIVAGTIGVISPSGHEVGPFLSIEQASLSHLIPPSSRTRDPSLATEVHDAGGELPIHRGSLCFSRDCPGLPFHANLLACGGKKSFGERRGGFTVWEIQWAGQISEYRVEAVRAFRARLIRGRFRDPELHGLLVLFEIWSGTKNAGWNLLLGQRFCRNFRVTCGAPRESDWIGADHGRHPSAFQSSSHRRAADANAFARDSCPPPPFQH